MAELTRQFGDGLAGFFGSGSVQLVLRLAVAYVVAVWLAAAWWAFRDAHDRTTNPVVPYLAAGLVIAFTPLLFPLGLVLYRIARPAERLTEREEHELTRDALLAEAASVGTCPGCDRATAADWLVCPSCATRLARRCPACERSVSLDWVVCAWCATELQPAPGLVPESLGRSEGRQPVGVMDTLAAVSDSVASVSAAMSEAVANAVVGARSTADDERARVIKLDRPRRAVEPATGEVAATSEQTQLPA
ncbi:MAG TPA: zinc ribbon domain-containing protein [Candidatus Limnocylindrales bacterium]